jgi:hypothetical protein
LILHTEMLPVSDTLFDHQPCSVKICSPATHTPVTKDIAVAHHGDKAAKRRVAAYNRAQRSFDKRVVIFAIPAAWRCDGEKSTVTTADGRLEPCTICTNIARTPQALSINKTEHTVPAQGHVAMCETSAFVGAP